MEQKARINLSIDDGEPFFAHEMSVNFNPLQFILDFRNVTPRNDPRTKDGRPSIHLKHNIIMVDPWHMLQIRDLMARMVTAYEKEFGKIKKPKQLEAFEKKHKKAKDSAKTSKKDETKTEVPSYFG